jgi:hypothetical protein
MKTDPGESSLYDPAPGQHYEAAHIISSFDDFQVDAIAGAQISDPVHQRSGITGVCPDLAKLGESVR